MPGAYILAVLPVYDILTTWHAVRGPEGGTMKAINVLNIDGKNYYIAWAMMSRTAWAVKRSGSMSVHWIL